MEEQKAIRTRHVLAVRDLKVETDYYMEKLGFAREFTVPGWEFLSFGNFQVMLGECSDEMTAEATGNHSWYAHVIVENVDELFSQYRDRGAQILTPIQEKPWRMREFCVATPDGHRIVFAQLLGC